MSLGCHFESCPLYLLEQLLAVALGFRKTTYLRGQESQDSKGLPSTHSSVCRKHTHWPKRRGSLKQMLGEMTAATFTLNSSRGHHSCCTLSAQHPLVAVQGIAPGVRSTAALQRSAHSHQDSEKPSHGLPLCQKG